MPELPEVETVVRHLKPDLVGQKILSFQSIWPKVLGNVHNKYFNDVIVGRNILDVNRRAKFIVLHLDNGFIPIHLRMTGRLYTNDNIPTAKHISAVFRLSDKMLIFQDTRKFGRVYWYDQWAEFDQKHGVEPLGELFTKNWLQQSLQGRKRQVKALLLDQHIIAGLGNIYVDEALWSARIHPLISSNNISSVKSNRLHESIKVILEQAIAYNGTTFINFTFQDGVPGSYRNQLQVFDRKGLPCKRCETVIKKIKAAGRGTYFCPRCQKI
ncbi:MAG: bifunctional DNA-formamidopyrimidine glycosylase/DNA-(apurinic or apyrimidinic site) lyase [Candidatus Marinimicrobia bacterium]|jgi:formamidopyrimidine-DNA glycosylase|nr:bifunctional DNA-formamidopyrimidine glycosylase/DNA-(apurinic or apyrimidinic site) lyase [Candidatus Neomarinimicrobiota bacterium]MDP7436827.1 bifunctional DNA-formamidopyrimidine glycosylase/DNA-(apurinic or apyrimidinic site) lyase [Candidatus Neomarinimicrobiota bacterium]MDP7653515.1 bifunctional DNA-formamidopyrimidine glycosylase/DNA-(apurinic or apyrimidinic site) lyase [Candidatus Neomarinimicrobiota bacterium]|tara:strand:+ start:427 stop:1233 length:807 start_codon:yes stop_codon:yes gene_type:complete